MHNLYGPTEAAIDVSHWSCHSDDTCIPIGKPIANTRLHVLDANHQPLPIGIAGELCIAGIQLGLGYLNRPELTAEKFINVDIYGKSERIYKTGDLAKWNATGNVEYLGRMDNQVKLRGFRIELGEIETLLLQYPAITNGVVVIRDAGEIELTKQLVAYIVSSKVIDILQLRSYLNQQLPDYMIPSHIMAIDALPLLQNGKLDRKSLPEPIYNTNCYLYPRDVIEFRLIQIWEQLFGLPSVSLEDDFFAIGGDSLLAVRLIFEIEQVFAIHLPLPTIFQCRTIEQLAILLRKGTKPKDWSPIVCLQPEGKKTPLFFIHASGGSAFDHLDMAKNISTERPFYALHPKGIELHEEFHSSIEEMANDYVSAIRSVQSVGPYLLAGWSFGGTVAYAMAAIFEKLGERVPLVMMIDSPAISVNFNKDDDVEFLLDRLPHYHGMKLEHLDEDSSAEEQMAYLLNEIKLAGLFSPDIDPAYAKNWFELYKHHNSIISRYQPTDIISSQIAFFKPAEKTSFDIQMGDSIVEWSAFTDKKIIVNEGAGNHFNMVSPTNTPALAQQINNLIVAIHS